MGRMTQPGVTGMARSEAGGPTATGTGEPTTRRRQGEPLSTREREILGLLAAGATGGDIANALVLSPATVRTHIRNAMAKLGALSRAHAVALALRRGEIQEADAEGGASKSAGGQSAGAPSLARFRARGRAASGEWREELTEVLAQLASLYDVDAGSMFVTDEDGLALGRVARVNEAGEIEVDSCPETIVLGQGPLGRAALERRAQVVHGSRAAGDGNPNVFVPMVASGRLVGAICLAVRSSRFIGRGELLLLHTFGNRIAEILLGSGQTTERLKRAFVRFRMSWVRADAYA